MLAKLSVLALLYALEPAVLPRPVPPPGEAPAEDSGDDAAGKDDDDSSAHAVPAPGNAQGGEAQPDDSKRAEVHPAADDFNQFSDFVDTRVTFAASNINVFAGPGERLYTTSGYRIGVDPNFNLFLENVNTRFTGFETLSHMVLYKKLPLWWDKWESEAALAALVLANTDTGQLSLFDSGTYLRLIRKFGYGDESQTGSFDITAFPVSADRFRLGYTYIISWGGTAIFPGKLNTTSITEGAVPGIRFRIRGPGGHDYAFIGAKSAQLLTRAPGVMAGEQVPNYGLLAGGGYEVGDFFWIEANGGFFQKGTQERPGLEGRHINAFGISGRATLYQGAPPKGSVDYLLYRNDPSQPDYYYMFREYVPGTSFSVSVEGDYLTQNLENPDQFGSEKNVPAPAAGLVALAKWDEFSLRLDGFYKSADFILFNVPGFVPFQAIPAASTSTPEYFGAITGEYWIESWHSRPSLALGVKMPATYHGPVPSSEAGATGVGGAMAGEVRTQVIVDDQTRVVLPPGVGAVGIFGAVLKVPFFLSKDTAVSGEVRYTYDNNQPRLAQDPARGEKTYFFDNPNRLSLAAILQSRW
jgi:hypothetical protein